MIELTTSAMILFSIFYSGPTIPQRTVESQPKTEKAIVADPMIVDNVAFMYAVSNKRTVEGAVREYFRDTPILAEIAKCESTFRHTGDKGEIIRGIANSDDIGVMQINEYYHSKEARNAGINLKTLEGNMAFAKRLYDKFGTSPWISSANCWQKYTTIAKK
ncbi:MAG: hypothetical protein EXS59_00315 [Candidatus Taylorbacteria bacterium]|nr:hypothetical protein [Candidatus Taylorbacteria bacterium]